MSERDYNTARSLTLRDAASPANRKMVEAYLNQQGNRAALHALCRLAGEAAA